MADLKITQLTELTSPLISDILPIVDDPSGSPVTKKITLSNLLAQKTIVTVSTSDGADYVCDGANDEVQINQAITAVATAGGGIVYLKEGTYELGNADLAAFWSPTLYGGVIMKDKVTLKGEGINKTILNLTTMPSSPTTGTRYIAVAMDLQTNNDMVVEDLSITLPAGTQGGSGYWATGIVFTGSRCVIRNVHITNGDWGFIGVSCSFNTTTKEITTDTTNCLADNVITTGNTASCSIRKATDCTVRQCRFYSFHDDAFLAAVALQRITFIDNVFDGEGTTGGSSNGALYIVNDAAIDTDLFTVSDIKIIGNTFRRHQLSSNSGGIALNTAKNIIIQGNIIEKCKGDGINNTGGTTLRNITITDNIIRLNEGDGIDLQSTAGSEGMNIIIQGNRIYNNTSRAINLTNQTNGLYDGITIQGNEIWDDQGASDTQTTGIRFLSTGSGVDTANIKIEGNNIYDTDTPIDVSTSGGATFTNLNIRNNTGFITEATGTGTIANGATSATITHGLSWTPTLSEITITGGENPTADIGTIWVDTIGATTFKVNCEVDPSTSGFDFGWKVTILRTTL